jgi:ribosomal protein L7Ae-like RNA K-turn-binding protein
LNQQNKILSYLGLAARGRRLVSGEFSTEQAVKKGNARVVIVAADASENTKKNFRDMCTYYKVNIYFYADKEQLGHAIGKQYRASIAVTDANLAKAIEKVLSEEQV